MLASWPCPSPGGASTEEYGIAFDRNRTARLLIIPALFDEANRLRRFTVDTMRALDRRGVDSFLPDLPGTNESPRDLSGQSLTSWRAAIAAAAAWFRPTHVLALRGGCLVMPAGNPALQFAPQPGSAILRQLLRARVVAAREAGIAVSADELKARALAMGIELAGYSLSAAMMRGLQDAGVPDSGTAIDAGDLGGRPLWLRAEPDEDAEQSAALAQRVAEAMQA